METITFSRVHTEEEIQVLSDLASEIWNQHFVPLIGQQQVDYMLEKFQSAPAMSRQIEEGMWYYLVSSNNIPAGYCGFKEDDDRIFLSKLYVRFSARGHGIGRKMFQKICEEGTALKKRAIYLTVNKYNTNTIQIYQHLGFQIVDAVVTDIGNDYVMDDYIMEYMLT